MADAITEAAAKLQLDEETGEMVSKNELKKRLAKRAKKAASAARAKNQPPATGADGEKAAPKPAKAKTEGPQLDPEAMFKQGFLAQVYKERPTKEVLTRFPPEPNGFLHLGHAKAIAINFGFAKYHGGKTILRFDDTNPDKEKHEYFVAIEETIRWLGFKPDAITYSSDNFQQLYDLAEKLIELEKAYVCHCKEAEIKLQRGGKDGKEGPRYRCAHADQDVETNLAKFRDMRDGKYEPQAAFLRMRQDLENGNPQMWDLAAYRIPKDQTPHYRTGDKWRIYPTYDFAHCLCDSFEGITHSLCTTEFILSRESYEWLNKTLGVYEPMQREYGRLNISGTIMSKRSLNRLVDEKIVRGWDDPRLYTLSGLRRRGVPPGAILSFINELGVTTAKTTIQIPRFEQSVRQYLEMSVPRLMLLLDPVPIVIEDLGDLEGQELDIPFSPKNPKMGSHKLRLTKTVYIDRSDFREVDSPDYFRLAPGKTVGLLQIPYPVKATTFTKDPTTGNVTEIRAVLDKEGKKPKTYIQWVPEGSRKLEVRIHKPLFKSDDPTAVEGGFMADIDRDSETVYPGALVEAGFEEVRRRAPWPEAAGESTGHVGPESVRFQAMRVAYFAMDSDSTEDHVILNSIVSLKEDSGKKKN
ncbi:Glutaminyl-tRNA synthetase [Scedosporium apiospermum]|uniref:glutamine--tRNA ligase n=1 Tax=Pseudallescheria apiosperma TaxID=563466 RepID=A0A084GDN5_PSEDA|nr:Glutaminyl-tRNA synthetase [Scedosporium apiospermum]KEZ45447.1 Glutaminyl-tRNA synthetase [Scedosporium apiospermum]